MNKRLLLVDGSSVLSKNFFGTLPFEYKKAKTPEERQKALEKVMKNSQGQYTNAVYGMTKFLLKVIKKQQPTHVVIAWDVSRNTFRRELYSDYKGNRGQTVDALKSQFILAQQLFDACGFYQGMVDGNFIGAYEADDVIGTFAKKFEADIPTYIITGDQDSLQLITEQTSVWLSTGKSKELYEKRSINPKEIDVPDGCFEYTPLTFKEEYQLNPIQIIDMKALEGDSSDNIPGVKGVGPKAAIPLLNHYGTVEHIYEAIEATDEKELKAFFKEELGISRSPIANLTKEPTIEEPIAGKKAAYLSKELATIKTDIADYEHVTLEDTLLRFDFDEMAKQFSALEFRSLLAEIETLKKKYETITKETSGFCEEDFFSIVE